MIKLIKQEGNETIYWEVWQSGRTLIIHYGTVGDTGETEEMKLPMFQRAEKVMDELADGKVLCQFTRQKDCESFYLN